MVPFNCLKYKWRHRSSACCIYASILWSHRWGSDLYTLTHFLTVHLLLLASIFILDSETTEDETNEPQMETKEGAGRHQDKAGRRAPAGWFYRLSHLLLSFWEGCSGRGPSSSSRLQWHTALLSSRKCVLGPAAAANAVAAPVPIRCLHWDLATQKKNRQGFES